MRVAYVIFDPSDFSYLVEEREWSAHTWTNDYSKALKHTLKQARDITRIYPQWTMMTLKEAAKMEKKSTLVRKRFV